MFLDAALLGALEAVLPRQKPFRSETEQKPSHSLQAFATLKRDVVQLLGLIAYHDKPSQDRIREAAGIHLILSLCVVDEYNPRECVCGTGSSQRLILTLVIWTT